MWPFVRSKKINGEAAIGVMGEDAGCKYLKQKGYKILARNYCNKKGYRLGEIDIVAEKEENLVFVEVKTRQCFSLDRTDELPPQASITASKLHKLEKIAVYYLKEGGLIGKNYHFDALAIRIEAGTYKMRIEHLEHIF